MQPYITLLSLVALGSEVEELVKKRWSNFSPLLQRQIREWQSQCVKYLETLRVCDSHHSAVLLGLVEIDMQFSGARHPDEFRECKGIV